MKSIQIDGKKFELVSLWKRLAAFFIDVLFLMCFSCLIIVVGLALNLYLGYGHPYSGQYWHLYSESENIFWIGLIVHYRFPLLGLWIFGLLFMDGYKAGQSPGKSALNIQVRRLKDGQPCGFKDAFTRRLIGILQPLDFFYILGKKRQRLGDKFTGTVVVEEVWEEFSPAREKSIHIVGKRLELADRLTRLFAFSIDVLILFLITVGLVFPFLDVNTKPLEPHSYVLLFTSYLPIVPGLEDSDFVALGFLIGYWIFGLFFMDGFNGQGLGKRVAGIQVYRLKDGKPCGFKDAFTRRLIGILQPLDFFYILGKKRQRLGDKFARTAVVKQVAEEAGQIVSEAAIPQPEQIEEELGTIIREMQNKIWEAEQKVEMANTIEKQFQDAHEKYVAAAARCHKNATDALKTGREDAAREELKKRAEHLRLAEQQKSQYENQKQSVNDFKELLASLRYEMIAAKVRGVVILAQHKNVDAEAHLRGALKALRNSKVFERVVDLEQEAIEDVILAKSMTEAANITDQDSEFSDYAEEQSIDEEIAALHEEIAKKH